MNYNSLLKRTIFNKKLTTKFPYACGKESSQRMVSSKKHSYFPENFKKRILCFVLCLKRIQQETLLKLPKYLIFEIIKFSLPYNKKKVDSSQLGKRKL